MEEDGASLSSRDKSSGGEEVSNIPQEELGMFIVEYESLVNKQKDLVNKHRDSVKKHENMVKDRDDLEKRYEDTSKKYQELVTQHRDTVEKHEDLSDKYEELNNEFKQMVKKYDYLIQQLKDKVECPVCLVVPTKAPIPVCPNGHVVCTECVREDCPKCRVKMEQGKSNLAVTVIENLDHHCKNEGCQEIIPFEGLTSHGKSCNYRLVNCPVLYCNEKVSLSSLASHMVSSNSSCLNEKIEVHKLPRTVCFLYTSNKTETSFWNLKAVKFGQHTFILKLARHIINGNGKWYFLVQMFGGMEETSGYRVTIIVHRKGEGPEGMYSQRYSGDVCPIDVTSLEVADEKGLCLLLSDGAMEKLLIKNSNSDTSFSVSFNLVGIDPANMS